MHIEEMMLSIYGSKLFGTDLESSDTDYKGVYLPSFKDFVLKRDLDVISLKTKTDVKAKNEHYDVDIDYYSLFNFLKLAFICDSSCIDLLHVDPKNLIRSSPQWEFIYSNRHRFYSKKLINFVDFAEAQMLKYSLKQKNLVLLTKVVDTCNEIVKKNGVNFKIKDAKELFYVEGDDVCIEESQLPNSFFYKVLGKRFPSRSPVTEILRSTVNRINCIGSRVSMNLNKTDWKSVYHAYRAALEVLEILETGNLTFPLKSADYLKQIRTGSLDAQVVMDNLNVTLDLVKTRIKNSTLPDSADEDFWLDWYINFVTYELKGKQA